MLQCILGRFDFSQNEFEMRLAKKMEEGPLTLTRGKLQRFVRQPSKS